MGGKNVSLFAVGPLCRYAEMIFMHGMHMMRG